MITQIKHYSSISLLLQHSLSEACGNEGQAGVWVAINELNQYPFPEANAAVLAKIVEVYGG